MTTLTLRRIKERFYCDRSQHRPGQVRGPALGSRGHLGLPSRKAYSWNKTWTGSGEAPKAVCYQPLVFDAVGATDLPAGPIAGLLLGRSGPLRRGRPFSFRLGWRFVRNGRRGHRNRRKHADTGNE